MERGESYVNKAVTFIMKLFRVGMLLNSLFWVLGLSTLWMTYAYGNEPAVVLYPDEVEKLMVEVDELSRFDSDFKALLYLQQKHREKGDLLYKAAIYRQDESDRLMMLFLKPKSDAGKGYLLLDKNLFLYTPDTGSWTRVSEDRISGTDTNLADFDDWSLSEDYKAEFVAMEKLGKQSVYHLKLTARPDAEVKAQTIHLWIELKKHFSLKIEEYAASGRLMRTTYRTKWRKLNDANAKVRYVPMETRIYDEIEKGNQTIVVIDKIALKPLPSEIFTKAWLESKSR